MNTFAYVNNDPAMSFDETGLVSWRGTVQTVSVVAGGGAVRLGYSLMSACIDGRKANVEVVAGGPAVGLGVTVAGVRSDVIFHDDLDYIFPSVFDGRAMFASASYAFLGFGYGFSAVELGSAYSVGSGWQVGWDASVSGGAGISTVTKIEWEDCCE